MPDLDGATYLPLAPMTEGQTGWKRLPDGSSPDDERRSP